MKRGGKKLDNIFWVSENLAPLVETKNKKYIGVTYINVNLLSEYPSYSLQFHGHRMNDKRSSRRNIESLRLLSYANTQNLTSYDTKYIDILTCCMEDLNNLFLYSLCHLCQSVATCDKILERGLGLLGGEAGGAGVGDQGRGLHHPVVIVHCAPELGEVISPQSISRQLFLHQAHYLHLRKVWGRGEVCKSGTVTTASLCNS